MIDSSPMYGSSQPVIGYGLERLGRPEALFSAEKVWTSSVADGPAQIEQSRRFWGVPSFDLVQVHNLVAWEAHLETLFTMKADGLIRYVGITTSEGRRHDLFEEIMRNHPLDFVQLTYNIVDREAEERLLPLATERGMAVIVNRPFQQGDLTRRLEGEPLPDWASEIGAGTLGAVHPEVHPRASGRHRRHPGHHKRRSCAREHGCRGRPSPGCRHARADGGSCPGSLNVGMVDLPAGRFSALLAARLLAHVRTAQCRALAAASRNARRRPRHRPARALAAPRPWFVGRAHPRRALGLRRLVLSVEPLCGDQLGDRLCRAGLRPAGAAARARGRGCCPHLRLEATSLRGSGCC